MKRFISSYGVALILAGTMLLPAFASAATVQSTASLQAQLSALLLQVQQLQAQVALLHGGSPSSGGTRQCYPSGYGTLYCYTTNTQYPSYPVPSYGTNRLREIEVDSDDDFARISIEYTSGREEEFILGGVDERDEVIDFLIEETDHSRTQILSVISWDGDFGNNRHDDDVDAIDVDIVSGDARVRVEYDDGDIDRFTIEDETNHNDIIKEIADELDMDEDDVEDLVDFDNDNSDDVEDIDVTIDEDDEDARAVVRFDDGDTDTFTYNTDDEDDIIEELADELDMDEDDVEDLVDFHYKDTDDDDIDSIDVTIYEDDEEARVRVEYENGSTQIFWVDSDDEDDIIEEIADELDMNEDDVEDLVDFDESE